MIHLMISGIFSLVIGSLYVRRTFFTLSALSARLVIRIPKKRTRIIRKIATILNGCGSFFLRRHHRLRQRKTPPVVHRLIPKKKKKRAKKALDKRRFFLYNMPL